MVCGLVLAAETVCISGTIDGLEEKKRNMSWRTWPSTVSVLPSNLPIVIWDSFTNNVFAKNDRPEWKGEKLTSHCPFAPPFPLPSPSGKLVMPSTNYLFSSH